MVALSTSVAAISPRTSGKIRPEVAAVQMPKVQFAAADSGASLWQKCRLLLTGVVLSLGGSAHFGWSLSIINPAADVLQSFLRTSLESHLGVALQPWALHVLWPAVAGLLFIGAFVGGMAAPKVMKICGLNGAFFASSALICASILMAGASEPLFSAELFVLHRLLIGVGIGVITTAQTVYIAEVSPTAYRGLMGTLTGFSTSIGFVAASGVGLPQVFGQQTGWWRMFAVEMIPSLILLLSLLLFLQKSPVRLLKEGKQKEALRSLELFHSKAEAADRLAQLEREARGSRTTDRNDSFVSIWKESKSALCICLLLNATVSFSGITAAGFFGTLLLRNIGFSDNGAAFANCIASFSGLFGNVLGSFTIDKIGRRPLLITCTMLLAALNCALMVLVFVFQYTEDIRFGYAFFGIFNLFLFVFSLGVGPLAWFLATELCSLQHRARIQSLSISCQYLTCFLSSLIFLPLYHHVGPLSFLIFIVPLCLCTFYLLLFLPETKGRPIEEIVDDLQRRSLLSKTPMRDEAEEEEAAA
ncbi:MFS domain-containing protein [Aphelenchoides fujianensis]|nr:MFS domain-containing protein [Aphelenchoides fujianensis]